MPRRSERWPFQASVEGLFQQLLLLQREGFDFDIRREYVFHPTRKWRADFFLSGPRLKPIIVEYNGLFERNGHSSLNSGHRSVAGVMKDWSKGNEAQLLGILYLQFGPAETKTGDSMNVIARALKMRLESAAGSAAESTRSHKSDASMTSGGGSDATS